MMDQSEVWVTGIGIISPLGNGFEENIRQLRSGISPVRILSDLDSIHNCKLKVGQVALSNSDLHSLLDLDPALDINRATLFALVAVNQILRQNNNAGLTDEMSLISASTVGGMGNTELLFSDIVSGKYNPDAAFIDQMDCGSIARKIIQNYKIKGENYTLSTACSSGSNAIMLGSRMIKAGKNKMVLAGGTDSLGKFVLNGFISLKNVDIDNCKPFDAERIGLNLGEGSAFVLLEDSHHAEARNAAPFAKIKGYFNVNETYHITGSSPEGQGAFLAMTGALEKSNLKPENIDFIHAHGTSTIDNDLAESKAIMRIFGNKVPFASSKTFTGHTLAASGAISTVLSIGSMQESFIFPSLNFKEVMPETNLSPLTEQLENIQLQNCIVNSFGFGGNNTSLVISKV